MIRTARYIAHRIAATLASLFIGAIIALCASVPAWAQGWEYVGPDGGQIQAIALDTTTGTMYAGAWGGLYRSIDNGATWEYAIRNSDIPGRPHTAITTSEGAVYVYDGNLITISGNNVTVTESTNPCMRKLNQMVMLQGQLFYSDYDGGIFRFNLETGMCERVALEGGERALRLIATNNALYYIAGTVPGVFRSTNLGETWERIGLEYDYMTELLVIGNTILADASGYTYRSDNNGATWELQETPFPVFFVTANRGDTIYGVQQPNAGSTYAPLSSATLYRSTNRGTTWQILRDISQIPFVANIQPGTGDYLFIGTINGIYRIHTSTLELEQTSAGITSNGITRLFSLTGGGILAAGAWGLYRTTTMPTVASWTFHTHRAMNAFITARGKTVILWGPGDRYYFRSQDAGITWIEERSPTGNGLGPVPYSCLLPKEGIALFENDNGGYAIRSTDGGSTWNPVTQIGLGIRQDGERLYMESRAFQDTAIFSSDDYGATWNRVSAYRPPSMGRSVYDRSYMGNRIVMYTDSGLFYTDNFGQAWQRSTSENGWGTRFVRTGSLLYFIFPGITSVTPGQAVYGAHYSADSGKTWKPVAWTKNLFPVHDVMEQDGLLYAATGTHGVLSGPVPRTTPVPDPPLPPVYPHNVTAALHGVSPNPTTGEIVISYTIAGQTAVSLQIALYTTDGRYVRQLADTERAPGSYTLQADLGDLAAGAYYIQLRVAGALAGQTMAVVL